MINELAIFGGKPVVLPGMVKSWPNVTEVDEKAVLRVLRGREPWSYPPRAVQELQTAWASYIGIGVDHAVAVSSGTAALQLALMAVGVGAGDRVVVPALSWPSLATAVLRANCIPIFADVDASTLCISPEAVADVIDTGTRAVIAVNLSGLPADYDSLSNVCRRHSVILIEDMSQSHGAKYRGKKAGSLGDISACSINGSKNLSAFEEGGLVATKHEEWFKRMQLLRSFGENLMPEPEAKICQPMGWSYRMGNLAAAFALSQLDRLDEMNAVRVANCKYLSERLRKIPSIAVPQVPEDRTHVFFYYIVRIKPEEFNACISARAYRDTVAKFLAAEGVSIQLWQRELIPMLPLFQSRNAYGRQCPWRCLDNSQYLPSYSPNSYPVARTAMECMLPIGHSFGGLGPPNDQYLMSLYVDAFEKVLVDHLFEVEKAARHLQHYGGVTK